MTKKNNGSTDLNIVFRGGAITCPWHSSTGAQSCAFQMERAAIGAAISWLEENEDLYWTPAHENASHCCWQLTGAGEIYKADAGGCRRSWISGEYRSVSASKETNKPMRKSNHDHHSTTLSSYLTAPPTGPSNYVSVLRISYPHSNLYYYITASRRC